jgi:hypothetical protein
MALQRLLLPLLCFALHHDTPNVHAQLLSDDLYAYYPFDDGGAVNTAPTVGGGVRRTAQSQP